MKFFFKSKKGGSKKRPTREVNEKSCGVVLYRMNGSVREYLLLNYPGGHWDFPKGHVEERDDSEQNTARRELEEETGITDIKIHPGYREIMYYEFNRGAKERVKKNVVYFLAETPTEAVTISFEHKGFIWLPYEQAMRKLTFDNARELLEKGEKTLLAETSNP